MVDTQVEYKLRHIRLMIRLNVILSGYQHHSGTRH
jgi:hypothetical protein